MTIGLPLSLGDRESAPIRRGKRSVEDIEDAAEAALALMAVLAAMAIFATVVAVTCVAPLVAALAGVRLRWLMRLGRTGSRRRHELIHLLPSSLLVRHGSLAVVSGLALHDLLELTVIQPDTSALRAVVDLDTLSLCHQQINAAISGACAHDCPCLRTNLVVVAAFRSGPTAEPQKQNLPREIGESILESFEVKLETSCVGNHRINPCTSEDHRRFLAHQSAR